MRLLRSQPAAQFYADAPADSRWTSRRPAAIRVCAPFTHPGAQVDINGYTDDRWSAAANLKLSQMRATSTLNRLASLGIDKSRMTAEGHGEDNPVADNGTAEGRQQNRRVVITVTDR